MDRKQPIAIAKAAATSVAVAATTGLLYLLGTASIVFTMCYAYHWGI